jgi:hypothetical protein
VTGGAIHIDHSTGYVEIGDNVFHDIRAKGGNGGGLYIDDTTTNINCTGNLFYNLKGVRTIGLHRARKTPSWPRSWANSSLL